MASLLKVLGLAWTAWKVGTKRFGPGGGVLFATAAVAGFVVLLRFLEERHPDAAERLEALA